MSLSLNSLDSLFNRLQARAALPVQISPVETIFRKDLPEKIPGYETREQQIQMAKLIESALETKEHALCEAGTGTGKGFAYLIPLHLHLKQNGGRAIVSTGTIALQEQLIGKDIPFLEQTLNIDFKAKLAKGKSNYVCRLRLNLEAEDNSIQLFDREPLLDQLAHWAEKSTTGDRADFLSAIPGEIWSKICVDDGCQKKKCPAFGSCFYYEARTRLSDARIIVCNHALFFTDMAVRNDSCGNASILPEYSVVVFDESHHLESVARETLATKVSIMRLLVLLGQFRKLPGCDQGAVESALQTNGAFFAAAAMSGSGSDKFVLKLDARLKTEGQALLDAVEWVIESFDSHLSDSDGRDRANALKDTLRTYKTDLGSIIQGSDPNLVYWVEHLTRSKSLRVTLHATPVNVAPMLSNMLFKNEEISSIVMTSATLSAGSSFSYLKNSIGCSEARELCVESPFDYQNQCLLYLPPGLPDPKLPDFHERVAPVIEQILLKTDGRAFVLFTSYRGLNEVYERLADRLKWTVLKQGDMPKQALLEQFKADVHSVLFATSSFWEGVDVTGEALSCVILVKLPFMVPDDPVTQAKIEQIKRSGGNDFAGYMLPEAILRLKQGFGRLIRTRADRGIVAILDPRIKAKGYGQRFLRSLPKCREITSLENVDLFLKRDPQIIVRIERNSNEQTL